MEVQYRARRSFEKPRVEAPPRLQVIGFNVSPKADAAALLGPVEDMEIASRARASYTELTPPPQPKPASSPRSALQQLLHHHSSPSTSPSSSNHCLPPLLPPSTSSPSANQTLITAGSPTSHKPVCSSLPSNQNLTNGLLQPAAANHKWTNGGLLHPSAANKKWSSTGVSRPQSPPASAHESKSSTGHLKSLLQSVSTTSDIPANHSSHASISRSLVQSQCASSPASAGSQTMISKQTINQQNSKALIKENYEAFFQIKQTGDHARNPEAKAHEIKGQYCISNNKVTDEFPYAVKSKKSSWLHDEDDQTSAGKCMKSTWKGSNEHPLGNEKSRKSSGSEEKSKKSSLFMFAAPESHHQQHSGEHIIALTDMDFLSSCHLCRRFLGQGQDVFMYSGDKAFCSMECRYQQIVIDERKERCSPAIIRSGASPVYQQISATVSSTRHPVTINKPHFINTAAAA